MRVRQKLLEHVCAATTIGSAESVNNNDGLTDATMDKDKKHIGAVPDNHIATQHVTVPKAQPHTPPRSPTKTTSPQRVVKVVHPTYRDSYQTAAGRPSAESIRIYVESDVYGLLADVEAEMEKMAKVNVVKTSEKTADLGLEEYLGSTVFVPFTRTPSPSACRVDVPELM